MKVTKRYGRPGDLVTLKGRFFTKEYGNTNFQTEGGETDMDTRREESLTAVMLSARECELTDELGNLYGLTLDSEESNEGSITCKPGGTFIGPVNATVFVSGTYGKSQVKGAYSVNSKGQMFVYHTLPEVTSVSPNTGGAEGGTHITIRGNTFDSMAGKTQVMIGQTPCAIISVTNEELVCTTPAQADLTGTNAGSRGLMYELWNTTEDATVTDTSADDYHSMVLDGSTVDSAQFNETNGYTARLSGLFIAPYTGKIAFYLKSSDAATLYLSTNSDPANKTAIITNSGKRMTVDRGHPHSASYDFVEGEAYYIEATHVQSAGSSAENYLQISLWEHQTVYNELQMSGAQDEHQVLRLSYDRDFETQLISFNDMAPNATLRFTHAGVNAKADIALDDKDSWNETWQEMMTYTCEYSYTNHHIKQNYENPSYNLHGAGGYMNEEVQAYCGKRAMENQGRVTHRYGRPAEIDAKRYPWFCFAAKGETYSGTVRFLIRWQDNRNRHRRDWAYMKKLWTPSEDWSYQCLDMYTEIFNPNNTWIGKQEKEGSYMGLEDIILETRDFRRNYYMDEITISRERVDIERKAPALRNDNVLVNTVTVTEVTNTSSFNVEVVPWTCNTEEDDLELFGVKDANITEVDTTGMTPLEAHLAKAEYLKTADFATFTSTAWGNGTVTVNRTQRGTRRIKGKMKLTFRNQTIEIDPYQTGATLAPLLEAFGMIGVQTHRGHRDKRTCYNSHTKIDFRYSWGGDVEQIGYDGSDLILENGGKNFENRIYTARSGGVMITGPGPDFFRLQASQPTVSVSVNGFLANCAAEDCSFTHDASLTPSLDSVSGTDDEVTITGSGFSTDITDFVIRVGDLACEVTAASESSVTCTLEAGSAGVYDVSVVVKSLGIATQPSSGHLTYQVALTIFSNSPSEGSMGGGTTITVTGTGFPATLDGWMGGSVSIGGSECKVISTSYGEFQCITSANSGGSRKKRAVSDIAINLGSLSATGGSFNYDASLTPSVSSVSPTSSAIMGGDVMSIEGSAFGYTWGKVLIGEAECKVLTWFDATITCVLPANPHGDYPVHVSVPNQGYADVSTVSTINYNFIVTGMTPGKGSIMGGTKVKLTGYGFGNCSDIVVEFGSSYSCNIDFCNNTEILCTTKKLSNVHQVTNGGRHPQYGPGYIWSPQTVTIQPGDMVDWVWNLQVASDDTGISVLQTASSSSDEWDGKGFKSDKSPKGRLQQTFDAPGTYYYSSLPVMGQQLFMKGVVIVASSEEDTTFGVTVKMGGIIDAAFDPNSPPTEPITFPNCNVTSLNCVPDPVPYLFTFAHCLTPSVTDIAVNPAQNITPTPLEAYNGAVFTIEGTGFSPNPCQNDVTFGEHGKCLVTSSSDTEIVCTVDGSGDPPLESLNPVKINVDIINSGSAVFNVEDPSLTKFNLVPEITSSNLNAGSWAGGLLYILAGSGLLPYGGKDTVRVNFGEGHTTAACAIVDVKFDQISCTVPDFSQFVQPPLNEKTVPVTVYLGYDQFSPSVNLTFTYDIALTAIADSLSPTSVPPSEVTVVGSNFGDSTKVYLRSKNLARLRRRRSLPDRPKVEYEEPVQTSKDLWKKVTGVDPSNWKCLHGDACDFDHINTVGVPSARYKREADPLFPKYAEWAEEEYNNLLYEICLDDVGKCLHTINKRDTELGRHKREVSEEEEEDILLEMAFDIDGTYEATVINVTDTDVVFTIPALPAGQYDVIIFSDGQGNALSTLGALTSDLTVTTVSPSTGSIYGDQPIEVSGSGFCPEGVTTVSLGGSVCAVTDVAADAVDCVTSAHPDGTVDVEVTSCGQTVTLPAGFNYSNAFTPDISNLSPSSDSGPTTLTLTGSGFGTDPSVKVGEYECIISASSLTSVTCDIPGLPGGQYEVTLNNPLLGNSNSEVFFSILEISSVTPSSGSFGGGTPLNITGTGFDSDNAEVTMCSKVCEIQSITTSEIYCLTPANNATEATLVCDVTVTQPSGNFTKDAAFTYDRALTPTVASVSPVRGGTGGGTRITITGSGFADSGNNVNIDGSPCVVVAESATEIECLTEHHNGAIEAPVVVDVPDQGYAAYDDIEAASFYYIDRWSSIWTWGGLGTPLEGEFIVITEGQTILLDTSTPILAFLLIKGGKLMFDGDMAELELQSKYILLVDGGQLEIGTEEEKYPAESKAIITMHGHTRCIEMPVFGCKVIGVRNGTIDFHGDYVPVPWTKLAETADAGATEIVLTHPVSWKVGDHIALATTSDRSSMKENEEHYVAGVSADGKTVTLKDPLKYRHISIEQTFGDRVVESRGEVGLLTRNILIRGHYNEEFLEDIPACEQEFSSGATMSDAMQTCFAGKFGEELGSDEMGAIIIISPKYKNQGLVAARIEYTEFLNAGQAFRVGRYPIHFHLPGNVSDSYVRGNAIHHSNNRACTLHDVSNLLVEHNVVYNVKGLSFFIEDGVEEYNILQYNLAMFTRMSNSLLNPDINPASFWIVNPNNKWRHNACAGGTHFCFWLRPAKIPDGPSWTRNYCPNKVRFDEFYNNTAHSMGWYGFWIMGQSNHAGYDPHDGDLSSGYCRGNRIQARIGSFTTWNNKRGFEIVEGMNIRLENQTHMDHDFAGFDIFKSGGGPLGPDGPSIYNSIIVGHSEITELTPRKTANCTPDGIKMHEEGHTLEDVSFYNFDRPGCSALKVKIKKPYHSPSTIRTSGLTFVNSPNKVYSDPSKGDQAINYYDADGTLTGTAGATLLGDSGTNPPSCVPDATGDLGEAHQGGHPGSVCPPGEVFHRLLMVPSTGSLKYNTMTMVNEYGNSTRAWSKKKKGWYSILPQGPVNWFNFDNNEHVTNVSYSMSVDGMQPDNGNYMIYGHKLYQDPERITLIPGTTPVNASSLTQIPNYEDNVHGDWFLTNETASGNGTELTYIISDKTSSRKKRAVPGELGTQPAGQKKSVEFLVYRCFYEGCLPPPPPTIPAGRPANFHKWSNDSAWEELEMSKPQSGDTVFIPPGAWFVLDEDPPPLRMIMIEAMGALEVDDTADRTLEVEILLLRGGKLQVGTEETPFTHNFNLVLAGNHFTEDQPLPNGPNLGAKALGVFGFADMHGADVGTAWTKLDATAAAGDDTLELSEEVTWAEGSEVVITSTSYELHETERRTIKSVSGTTITLTEPLDFEHLGTQATLSDGTTFPIKAEVGLLSRNIKIIGKTYADQEEERFGARVLVGVFTQDGTEYKGYGRFANVEFDVAGQDGWYDPWDPRFSLAFLDVGDSTDSGGKSNAPESYVKKCAFNYNYNSALGLFGANNIPVEDNVIYTFINDGIKDEGERNKITGNLVSKGLSVARLLGQAQNPEWYGCFNTLRSTDVLMTGNVAAGCANTGFLTLGNDCEKPYQMGGNEAHTSQHGISLYSRGLMRLESGCGRVNDFFAWKNYDYAVHIYSENSYEFDNIRAVDNGVGILPWVVGPSAAAHLSENKYVSMENSIIVGVSDVYDCAKEGKPDIYQSAMDSGRRWKGRGKRQESWVAHHYGMIWPLFQSKFSKITHPWNQPLKSATGADIALRGIMHLNNVTFANFNENCGKRDVVLRTNFGGDDINWPINVTDVKFLDTPLDNRVYVDIPLLSKVNPSDCTDMDCDGFKKLLIYDNDGSFNEDGVAATIIPDSAFEWDKNPVRGLGYYRVPKPMYTTVDGAKLEFADIMPNKGIYRKDADSCTWNNAWRAYTCHGINHRIMIIESMDRDSKIRRLGPIAMLANSGLNGWIDLVNGPQDFSCCAGYICAERLSTFITMVATEQTYEVMFTSVAPQNFRLHLLHNEGGEGTLLKIWFQKQQRYDIYVGGRFIAPNNIDTTKDDYNLLTPDDSFIPLLEEAHGSNYFDPGTGHLYVLIKDGVIDIKTQPIVVLKLGMTVPIDDFFEQNVVANLAGLLGIDPSNIRVTNVVRENSVGRKKREAGEPEPVDIEFEIGPPPLDDLVDFMPEEYTYAAPTEFTENPAYTTQSTAGPTTSAFTEPAGYLNYDMLQNVQATITNAFQTGDIASSFEGAVVDTLVMEEPVVPPAEPPPYEGAEARGQITDQTFAEQQAQENEALIEQYEERVVPIPSNLHLIDTPEDVLEMQTMQNVRLYVTDDSDQLVSVLGDESDPWEVTVSVLSGPGNVLGNITVPFVGGLATFDGIFLDTRGPGYVLQFAISYPANSVIPATSSNMFAVGGRPLGLRFNEFSILQPMNTSFAINATIWDEALDQAAAPEVLVDDWECEATFNNGNFSGTTQVTLSPGKSDNKNKYLQSSKANHFH